MFCSASCKSGNHLCLSLCFVFTFFCSVVTAQIKWDGGGGDGQWSTAANWAGDIIPSVLDDVILDNSIVSGSYVVTLPATAVTVKSINLFPSGVNNIHLILPATTTVTPAFTANNAGDGIIINRGGLFTNSCGATSGAAVMVNGLMRINNGGQYTHNSRTSHAALVGNLSIVAGTESGVFKFDVPGSSYTISVSNRTYGSLVLSSVASGGSQTYTASAASPFTLNGDFSIEDGVIFNLDITAAATIRGNYLQQGGVWNLASQPNNNIINIKGDFLQSAGTITETSTGLPVIELNGATNQRLQMSGSVINSVELRVNNAAGIRLNSDIKLPYRLSLIKGIIDGQNFLTTLLAGTSITADSTSNNSFINGRLRREGFNATGYAYFPVGKGTTQRWLELKQATGSFTVEFFKSSPKNLSASVGAGIHHISSIEYWKIDADAAPAPIAQAELSFNNVNSGGITDMSALRAAKLINGVWMDIGNVATTGTPGAAGSVISNSINSFDAAGTYLTMASSDAFQNALPVQWISFSGNSNSDKILFNWQVNKELPVTNFVIEYSADAKNFSSLAVVLPVAAKQDYQYSGARPVEAANFYRLKLTGADAVVYYSKTIELTATNTNNILRATISKGQLYLFNPPVTGNAVLSIYDVNGKLLQSSPYVLQKGRNAITLSSGLQYAGGIFIVNVTAAGNKLSTIRTMNNE